MQNDRVIQYADDPVQSAITTATTSTLKTRGLIRKLKLLKPEAILLGWQAIEDNNMVKPCIITPNLEVTKQKKEGMVNLTFAWAWSCCALWPSCNICFSGIEHNLLFSHYVLDAQNILRMLVMNRLVWISLGLNLFVDIPIASKVWK